VIYPPTDQRRKDLRCSSYGVAVAVTRSGLSFLVFGLGAAGVLWFVHLFGGVLAHPSFYAPPLVVVLRRLSPIRFQFAVIAVRLRGVESLAACGLGVVVAGASRPALLHHAKYYSSLPNIQNIFYTIR
jgi:hypothetical protein